MVYKNKSDSDLVWQIQLISIKVKKIPTHQHEFLTFNNHQIKSESKIYIML